MLWTPWGMPSPPSRIPQHATTPSCHCAQDRTVTHLLAHVNAVAGWGELMQMVALDLVCKVCRSHPTEKGRYIKIVISLLVAPSAAIIYECAGALVSLSSAPIMPEQAQAQPAAAATRSKHSHAASHAQPAPRKVRFNVGA